MTAHSIIIDSTCIRYWQQNHDQTQVALFIHGFKGDHRGLQQLASQFKRHRVIMVDLPGYGQSGSLPHKHSLKAYAKFIHQFTTALNITRFDLVGHSYGGSIAIIYAATYSQSVSHLLLISPAVADQGLAQKLASWQLVIGAKLPGKTQSIWFSNPLLEIISSLTLIKYGTRKRRLAMLKMGIDNSLHQHPQVIQQSLSSFLATPLLPLAHRITAPTFILAGEKDIISPLSSLQILAQNCPQAKIELLSHTGHLSPLERPALVSRIIHQFTTHQASYPTHFHQPNTPTTPKTT